MSIKIKSFWPAAVWFLFATILFCLPGSTLPKSKWFDFLLVDKWFHIGLFAVLVILICLPLYCMTLAKGKRFFLVLSTVMNCFLYGIVMEVVQYYFISNRSFDFKDIVGDAVGCFAGWYFIQYYSKKKKVKLICFYGSESTGKSVLAQRLAKAYKTEYVPEVAREIVTSNQFTVNDSIEIAKAQNERVIQKTTEANIILFCDTDVITTQIYCQHYLQQVPPILYELEAQINYDYYFLFDIGTPWIPDGLRELGSDDQRQAMFTIFKNELEKRKIKYTLVSGSYEERERQVREVIDRSCF